jgi:CRP/FNR family transcriptional regulator
LARVLLALARDYGEETPEGPRIRLRLTHQVLADLSGLRRETITQTLTAFRSTDCLKVEAHHFILTDLRRIEREAE